MFLSSLCRRSRRSRTLDWERLCRSISTNTDATRSWGLNHWRQKCPLQLLHCTPVAVHCMPVQGIRALLHHLFLLLLLVAGAQSQEASHSLEHEVEQVGRMESICPPSHNQALGRARWTRCIAAQILPPFRTTLIRGRRTQRIHHPEEQPQSRGTGPQRVPQQLRYLAAKSRCMKRSPTHSSHPRLK